MSWIRFEDETPKQNVRVFAMDTERLWWGTYNPENIEEGMPPFVPIVWAEMPVFTKEEIEEAALKNKPQVEVLPPTEESIKMAEEAIKEVEHRQENEKASRPSAEESGSISKKSRKK